MLQNNPHRILIYHGIDHIGRKDLNMRFISAAQLEAELLCFREHFEIIGLDDFFKKTSGLQTRLGTASDANLPATRPLMAVTFDDGYLNNLDIALPILEKHQIPATFFITGIQSTEQSYHWPDALDICVRYNNRWSPIQYDGHWYFKIRRDYRNIYGKRLKQEMVWGNQADIAKVMASFAYSFEKICAKKPELAPYWQIMSTQQIRQAAASPLIDIGVHGLYHYNLAALSFLDAQAELLKTKIFLEEIIQKSINMVAWPFGLYAQEVADYAASIGLVQQYAVDFLFPQDAENTMMRERIGVHPNLKLEALLAAIKKGCYQ
jgi:peptidoglycan/xylan/chitin deacetylase (PgdA/CDA1 family)